MTEKHEVSPHLSVEQWLEKFSANEKVDLVIQSFMVGSGVTGIMIGSKYILGAHDYYVLYLSLKLNLTPIEAGHFLSECFFTLPEVLQREVIQAAYHRHLPVMKQELEVSKRSAR